MPRVGSIHVFDELVLTNNNHVIFEQFILISRVDRRNEVVSGGEFKQAPGGERAHLVENWREVLVCSSDILMFVEAVLQ